MGEAEEVVKPNSRVKPPRKFRVPDFEVNGHKFVPDSRLLVEYDSTYITCKMCSGYFIVYCPDISSSNARRRTRRIIAATFKTDCATSMVEMVISE